MEGSLPAFVQSIKVNQCRICKTPNLIFLCGGPTADPKHPELPFESARDYFYRHINKNNSSIAKRLKLAEEINDWYYQEIFTDLLELEEYLADLADVIILFVESPGSIAELGAFATSNTLRPKILAIINSLHSEKSFIANGPILRLTSTNPKRVHFYAWDCEQNQINNETNIETFRDLSQELTDVLLERENTATKESTLDMASTGHTMLLIADLVDIIGITSSQEVNESLSSLGLNVPRLILRKYLFLLEQLHIVRQWKYSNQIYYVTRNKGPFIRYDFREDAGVKDRGRAKVLIRQALSQSDPKRVEIYKKYVKRTKLKGEVTYV